MTKKLTLMFATITLVFSTLFSAVTNLVSAQENADTTVVVHKILMSKEDLEAFTYTEDSSKYSGGQIADLAGYFGGSAQEIAGVAFNVYQEVDAATAGAQTGAALAEATSTAVGGNGFVADKSYVQVGSDYITTATGASITLSAGTYVFVENKATSPYYNSADGAELTAAKAVPFTLTLPQAKFDGTGYYTTTDALHVYPKNTEDKPQVDKVFEDTQDRTTKNVAIGDEIPYQVTTVIPKDSAFKTVRWVDDMLEGLDYVPGSLVLTDDAGLGLVAGSDYTLTETLRGFILTLTDAGLAKLETAAKAQDVTFKLTYKGILNDSAAIETLIPNKVRFDYGNRPGFDTTPKPVTPTVPPGGDPKNAQITVNKLWEGEAPAGTSVTFKVYEQESGKLVDTVVLAAGQSAVTVTGLDADKQYLILEDFVSGYLPEYVSTADGSLVVTNKVNPNPNPISPEDPNVITYGRRFVKIGDSDDANLLANAKFVVLNATGQYLALKSAATQATELTAYKAAEEAYQTAVKEQAADIDAKKAARDATYEALNMQWTFVASQADAFEFTSGADGRFEIRGLQAGTYRLQETQAPEGYALLTAAQEFTVDNGTWTDAEGIEGHTRVNNKKITIPQTGGIGTLVFTIGGLALMAFAFFAMKKREANQA